MSKKNIIKLNKQYFSCNPINENFEDLPVINAETEPITIDDNISSEKVYIDTEENKEPLIMSNQKISPHKHSKGAHSKKRSKKHSKKRSKRSSIVAGKRRSKKLSKRGSKKGSRKGSKKGSRKGSKKRSKKRSKKSREGFCAGNTCITESDLKNIINLLKNLELKK